MDERGRTRLFAVIAAAVASGATGCAKREAAAMTSDDASTAAALAPPSSLARDAGPDASDAEVDDAGADDAAPDALPLKPAASAVAKRDRNNCGGAGLRASCGLSRIGRNSCGAPANCGAMREVRGPKGEAQVSAVSVVAGSLPNVERVVAGRRARFRACFQKGLAVDPSQQGKIVIEVVVAKDGAPKSANVVESTGVAADVASCSASGLRTATFDPPASDEARVRVAVTFVRQD